MLDLLKTATQQNFSAEYFRSISKKYIPQGITKELAMFINQGKTIELNKLVMFLPIEKTTMGAYDLGFNGQIFRKEKIIKKIRKNSNAYKAGLRNNDKVIDWNPLNKEHDPRQILTIKTINKMVRFRPEHPNKKTIYQLKTNLNQKNKIKIKKFFGA